MYFKFFIYIKKLQIKMSSNNVVEAKEPDKEEIKKKMKEIILKIFNQVKVGCSRNICYNIYCNKNSICKESK